MCRWIAYSGRPIYLNDALFKPENSLIHQSLHASRALTATNGDGFGIGWYGSRRRPGIFRDVHPAWNDENLLNVSEQVSSGLFFAHVRHSTGTSTSRTNCHPFRHENWLFMHNGQIGGYDRIRRELDMMIDPCLYGFREGTTDSEALFYLLIGNGLADDVQGAFERTITCVLQAMDRAGIAAPLRFTATVTDGEQIFAIRYSSDRQSPSLFYGHKAFTGVDGDVDKGAVVILSEPLDSDSGKWVEIPEGHFVVAGDGAVSISPLNERL
ncbi:MAG: class II glutamine amidotransferase [Alphaproteobacteria bacterium]